MKPAPATPTPAKLAGLAKMQDGRCRHPLTANLKLGLSMPTPAKLAGLAKMQDGRCRHPLTANLKLGLSMPTRHMESRGMENNALPVAAGVVQRADTGELVGYGHMESRGMENNALPVAAGVVQRADTGELVGYGHTGHRCASGRRQRILRRSFPTAASAKPRCEPPRDTDAQVVAANGSYVGPFLQQPRQSLGANHPGTTIDPDKRWTSARLV